MGEVTKSIPKQKQIVFDPTSSGRNFHRNSNSLSIFTLLNIETDGNHNKNNATPA